MLAWLASLLRKRVIRMASPPIGVRVLTSPGLPDEVLAFVRLPGERDVKVRRRRNHRWRCEIHGTHRAALCPHEGAALAAWRRMRREEATTQPNQEIPA